MQGDHCAVFLQRLGHGNGACHIHIRRDHRKAFPAALGMPEKNAALDGNVAAARQCRAFWPDQYVFKIKLRVILDTHRAFLIVQAVTMFAPKHQPA